MSWKKSIKDKNHIINHVSKGAARYFNGLHMSSFTTFFGILSVLGGIGEMMGLDLGGAVFLIVIDAALILKPWFDKHQPFGKAEHS
jgi:hypothetical protein